VLAIANRIMSLSVGRTAVRRRLGRAGQPQEWLARRGTIDRISRHGEDRFLTGRGPRAGLLSLSTLAAALTLTLEIELMLRDAGANRRAVLEPAKRLSPPLLAGPALTPIAPSREKERLVSLALLNPIKLVAPHAATVPLR
jgi:hypothetical protein